MSNGYVFISPSNNWQFTNSRSNDFLFYTQTNTQQMLFGVNNNANASLVLNSNFSYFNNNNVGIGYSNPTVKLDVGGDLSLRVNSNIGGAGAQINFFANDITSASSNPMAIIKSSLGNLDGTKKSDAGDLIFYTRLVTGPGTNSATIDERLRILHNGNVGIGTNNPSSKLHVVGDIWGNEFNAITDGTAALPVFTWSNDPDTGVYHPNSNQIGISTNGTLAMFINSNQYIGFNTTTPLRPIELRSTFSNGMLGLIQTVANTQCSMALSNTHCIYTMGINTNNSGNSNFTFCNNVAGNIMTFNSNGNVAIGYSNPTVKLDVGGDLSIRANVNSGGAGAQLNFFANTIAWASSNPMAVIKGSLQNLDLTKSNDSGDLLFLTRSNLGGGSNASSLTEAMRITHAGNIGIGTNAPTSKLHVNGISCINNAFIYNLSFSIPTDTNIRYINISITSSTYILGGRVSLTNWGYGDPADRGLAEFTFAAGWNGGSGSVITSSLTTMGGAGNLITITGSTAQNGLVKLGIQRTTTLYNTYNYNTMLVFNSTAGISSITFA